MPFPYKLALLCGRIFRIGVRILSTKDPNILSLLPNSVIGIGVLSSLVCIRHRLCQRAAMRFDLAGTRRREVRPQMSRCPDFQTEEVNIFFDFTFTPTPICLKLAGNDKRKM